METVPQQVAPSSPTLTGSMFASLVLAGFYSISTDIPVKLFVGQVPKTMMEDEVRKIFEPCGPIKELTIIRDPATGEHRGMRACRSSFARITLTLAFVGCAFIIFENKLSAENAINWLHNKTTLFPCKFPLQVKYADGELERMEHKLFIGMVPRTATEEDLRQLFAPFGQIDHLGILYGPGNVSKGCAFLRYATREQALAAINAMNGHRCVTVSLHRVVCSSHCV